MTVATAEQASFEMTKPADRVSIYAQYNQASKSTPMRASMSMCQHANLCCFIYKYYNILFIATSLTK